jgi:hypothetical protein
VKPVGILYEHPQWFVPLFAELDRRGVPYEPIHAAQLRYDPRRRQARHSVVLNRMSPSAATRGHRNAIFHALHYLGYLDEIGATVVNGRDAYALELSKARQAALLGRVGARSPKTRVVARAEDVPAAARGLEFPVLVKPNVGGSGAGIVAFDSPAELAAAVPGLELGIDGTALVQEQLPAEGGAVVRLEFIGDRLLYAIRLLLAPDSFNLCPADYCELPGIADGVSGRGVPIEAFEPPLDVVEQGRAIVAAAELDVAGIEYLVNARDGLPYFYDVNVLSNFVADAPNVVGFDPFVDLVDLVLARADKSQTLQLA